MATSLDALEALLQFREGASNSKFNHLPQRIYRPGLPVPNPLDPTQPHLIEGDAQSTVVDRRPVFGFGVKSTFSPPILSPDAAAVPDPLAMPATENKSPRHPSSQISAIERLTTVASQRLTTVASQNWIDDHGFAVNGTGPLRPVASDSAFDVEVRTEKIRDALNSKPQRGKKRQDLNQLERQVLTRTRNREHAKSTRMKKKSRFDELLDIEKKYMLVKEKELLCVRKRERLVDFVEQCEAKRCLHSSRLHELASREIQNPEFSVVDSVALTAANSGTVKVSAYGSDVDSASPKTLPGVICVDFAPGSTDICDVSLYWSHTSSVSSFPTPVSMSYLEWSESG